MSESTERNIEFPKSYGSHHPKIEDNHNNHYFWQSRKKKNQTLAQPIHNNSQSSKAQPTENFKSKIQNPKKKKREAKRKQI